MKKVFEDKHYDYIKFDTLDEIKDFLIDYTLLLFRDKDYNLYCYDHMLMRGLRFDRDKYTWIFDGNNKSLRDYDGFKRIYGEAKKAILEAIPPMKAFDDYNTYLAQELIKKFDRLKKETPHKVVGWLDYYDLEGRCREVKGDTELYEAAILNDIEKHHYFFIAMWLNVLPVFEDATYLVLSDRAMGALIGISRGEARDMDYMPYTYGEDYFTAPEGTFNMPKKGLYPDR